MSKTYKGQITNNVAELTLQDEVVGGFDTPTIVWDDTVNGEIDQVQGDIPASWKASPNNGWKQLQIGSSCTSIGDDAFDFCSDLTGNLVIPDSVTSIGSYAFNYCTGFTGDLVIPDSVTFIDNGAFIGCIFDSLTLNNTMTTIDPYSFRNIRVSSGLTIPDNITTIGSFAFFHTPEIAFITNLWNGPLVIGEGVTSIGNYAFQNCSGFTGLTLGSNVQTIREGAFRRFGSPSATSAGLSGLSVDLVIPDGVTTIEGRAFQDSWFDGTLTIGSGLTNIPTFCFNNSQFTGDLVIPASVTSITDNAFGDCDGIETVTINGCSGGVSYFSFSSMDALSTLIIPDNTPTNIFAAFGSCPNLTTAYFGCSASAFTGFNFNSSGLTTIYVRDIYLAGYDATWKSNESTTATVLNWDNYPNPIPN